ncbi:MAG TPA: cupin domain-containing protein [Candidimonas sp.]|nr:cupin domain-containing protein [Candidimonas sp.]
MPTSSFVPTPAQLVRQLKLAPHPEGGHYRETYRSSQTVMRGDSRLARSASTAIYYLLSDAAYSAWHRIQSDEVWHFYEGSPLDIHTLDAAGRLTTYRLGNPFGNGSGNDQGAVPDFQVIVPAGLWFAAELVQPQSYALVGCTVAPGFEFSEFELADAAALRTAWPRHAEIIERLAPRQAGMAAND